MQSPRSQVYTKGSRAKTLQRCKYVRVKTLYKGITETQSAKLSTKNGPVWKKVENMNQGNIENIIKYAVICIY